MYRLSIAYAASLLAYLIVDGVVIFTFGARVYKETLKDVIADSFHVPPKKRGRRHRRTRPRDREHQ